LIDVDAVELDDGHAHGDEAGRMRFECFVTHQTIDVFGRARPASSVVAPASFEAERITLQVLTAPPPRASAERPAPRAERPAPTLSSTMCG
jgi:hypothetical protein